VAEKSKKTTKKAVTLEELREIAENQLRVVRILENHAAAITEARKAYEQARSAYVSDLRTVARARQRADEARAAALAASQRLDEVMRAAIEAGALPSHVEKIAGRSRRHLAFDLTSVDEASEPSPDEAPPWEREAEVAEPAPASTSFFSPSLGTQ